MKNLILMKSLVPELILAVKVLHLSTVLGKSAKWSEMYRKYIERISQRFNEVMRQKQYQSFWQSQKAGYSVA